MVKDIKITDVFRRRLKGLHHLPKALNDHKELVNLAVSRPVNLLLMEEEISKRASDLQTYSDSIMALLTELSQNQKALPELLNIIVSALRAFEQIDPSVAIQFGYETLITWPDMRGFKTLYPILDQSGKVKEQKVVIEAARSFDSEWADKTLQRLEFNIQNLEVELNLIEIDNNYLILIPLLYSSKMHQNYILHIGV